MLGIIQEQHAERCRLFAQWKQFDWPIVQDPINKLGLAAVPIVVEVDAKGVTRAVNPSVESVLASLGSQPLNPKSTPRTLKPDMQLLTSTAKREDSTSAWTELGDALVLWDGSRSESLEKAVEAYRRAAKLSPEQAAISFRLGVTHRMLYDIESPRRATTTRTLSPISSIGFPAAAENTQSRNHFRMAVDHWGDALGVEPNQYIYRRRIQQYGPRLIKPYPFYNWVEQARADIRARGEVPLKLSVEPSGAEVALPTRELVISDREKKSPDPHGRIHRDTLGIVRSEVVAVPARVRPGQSARIHVSFRLDGDSHWNNESDPLVFWIDLPQGWKADRQWFSSNQPREPESSEERTLEFEVQLPPSASPGEVTLQAYALYYVCESRRGACLYLRKDVAIRVQIDASGYPGAH